MPSLNETGHVRRSRDGAVVASLLGRMSYVAFSRAASISPILDYLQRTDAPVERILAAAGLPRSVARDREALIPAKSMSRLLRVAARTIDVPNLGFTIGERFRLEQFGVYGTLMHRSRTLGEMLASAVRYVERFTSAGALVLRGRGDHVELHWASPTDVEARDPVTQQRNDFVLGVMLAMVRAGTGPTWRPAEVHLQACEHPALRDARSLAESRISFRQPTTMILIPRRFLGVPLVQPPASDVVRNDFPEWESSAPAHDFVGSIRQAIEALSGDHYPSIGETADFVELSVRTLQRHLASAGTSHERLVAESRFAMATRVLAETDARIIDVALDLGYSEHANFTRAFRRWAGCSPRAYRFRQRLGSDEWPGEGAPRLHESGRLR